MILKVSLKDRNKYLNKYNIFGIKMIKITASDLNLKNLKRKEEFTNSDVIARLSKLSTKVTEVKIGERLFSRHINRFGKIGGFVESTARINKQAYVGPNAVIYENAWIHGGKITGHAKVHGNAEVFIDSVVCDNAEIFGYAKILQKSIISQNAIIHGHAEVKYSSITDYAEVYGKAVIEHSKICEHSKVFGETTILDSIISGYSKVFESSEVFGAKILDFSIIHRAALINGPGVVIKGNSEVVGVVSSIKSLEIKNKKLSDKYKIST